MKNFLRALLLTAAPLFGADIAVNGTFSAPPDSRTPTGWTVQNTRGFVPPGMLELLRGTGGANAVRFTAPAGRVAHLVSNAMFPVSAGGKILIDMTASGNGTVGLGVYALGARGEWLFNDFRNVVLSRHAGKHQVYIVVRDQPKRPATAFAQAVLSVQPGRQATVTDFSVRYYPAR